MKVLQLCHKPPYPSVDGGCMAMAAITQGLLNAGHTVKVLCMSTHRHPFASQQIPKHLLEATQMGAVAVDVRVKPLEAVLNLFSSESYNISRFHSETFQARLVEVLTETEFNIIHLESLFCTPYLKTIRAHSKAKVVVRAHNVEHVIWQRLTKQEKNPIKRWYLKILTDRLRTYETSTLKTVDGIATITSEDKEIIQGLGITVPIQVVPMGMDMSAIPYSAPPEGPLRLYHIGSMDWLPNIEGIDHFIQEIWPVLHRAFPDITCHLAGRHMPQRLLDLNAPSLHIEGEVPSVSAFASDKHIMVVPLLSGGGMRIKIVEAMAMGKAIISTSIGAEGIPYTDGEHLLIANSPGEFVERLRILISDPSLATTLGRNARSLAEEKFGLREVTAKLTEFYDALI